MEKVSFLKLREAFATLLSANICNFLPRPTVFNRFSDINVGIPRKTESATGKIIMDGKEMNDTENETEYASAEDPLNMRRTVSNETTLISKMPNIMY